MANLYPSVEDLTVDSAVKAQVGTEILARRDVLSQQSQALATGGLYSGLGLEELNQYFGIDIGPAALAANMPQEVLQHMRPLACVTPATDRGLVAASIKQGIRELVLAKDGDGKLGVLLKGVDKGVFVAFVWRASSAAMVGLRFGDQILQINGENVAGWSSDKAMDYLKKCRPERITMTVRDRPYERTITAVKDSMNHIGFVFREGEITAIVKDSSAARNGVLINHQLVEVNGQNVVGLKDEETAKIIGDIPTSVTITIMPTFIYRHLAKSLGSLKKYMDRSIPEF